MHHLEIACYLLKELRTSQWVLGLNIFLCLQSHKTFVMFSLFPSKNNAE